MRNHKLQTLLAVPVFAFAIGVASSAFAAETTGQYIDDASITTKAKAALLADLKLKSVHISVETTHGAVELTGSVDNLDQEAEAVNAVNKIDGVKVVKDRLNIKTDETQ